MEKTKTLKVRIKDKHTAQLKSQAKSVNFVWNYINDLSLRNIKERQKFLSAFDMHKYTKGAGKELGLHSQTLQVIAQEYVFRHKQFKKSKLNWRKSKGSKRSLGWIPVNTGAASFKRGQVFFNGQYYKVWDSYGLSQYKFRSGCFNEDARGRWYFNIVVSYTPKKSTGQSAVGIDLGCKETATDSNGYKIAGREYRKLEEKLSKAQQANKKKQVRNIHAKIKNRRRDTLHKYTHKLVKDNSAIFVGNISSLQLVKTNMAKSVLDAGWGQLKIMLEYKCDHAGVFFEVINEAYTTQTCSHCGSLPPERPKGIAGLGIREWLCSECGVSHDRDTNAALNILALGHGRLAVGTPVL